MNRSVFVDNVAHKARISRALAERVVSAIFASGHGVIAEAVEATGEVEIDGFGTFEHKKRRHSRRHGKENGIPEPEIKFTPSPYFALPSGGVDYADDMITPEEAAIRRELVRGLDRVQGIEIEDVFPGGWADDKIRS